MCGSRAQENHWEPLEEFQGLWTFLPRDFVLRKLEALECPSLLSLPAVVFRLLEFTVVFSNLRFEKKAASSLVSVFQAAVVWDVNVDVESTEYCRLSFWREAHAPSILALGPQTPLHRQSPGLRPCAVQSFPEQNLS